jgi:hypothetical protein
MIYYNSYKIAIKYNGQIAINSLIIEKNYIHI